MSYIYISDSVQADLRKTHKLSDLDVILLSILISYDIEDTEDGKEYFPSVDALATQTHAKKNSVQKSLAKLSRLDLAHYECAEVNYKYSVEKTGFTKIHQHFFDDCMQRQFTYKEALLLARMDSITQNNFAITNLFTRIFCCDARTVTRLKNGIQKKSNVRFGRAKNGNTTIYRVAKMR